MQRNSFCMKIEEAIKQKKFDSATQKAVVNLMYTASWMESMSAAALKPHGISIQQYNLLRILRGQYPNPASVGLLQERMLDRMSNASRLVEKLRLKKLVERRECPADRRQVDVLITPAGLELLEKAGQRIQSDAYAIGLNEKEAEQLSDLLDKMRMPK